MVKAIFIGIDKHQGEEIPELSGARRDATALWALFTDTIDGLVVRLLVDEAATHGEVSQAIVGVLSAAETEDVIVISFAGHGSSDGRMVLFDTDVADLSGTALRTISPEPRKTCENACLAGRRFTTPTSYAPNARQSKRHFAIRMGAFTFWPPRQPWPPVSTLRRRRSSLRRISSWVRTDDRSPSRSTRTWPAVPAAWVTTRPARPSFLPIHRSSELNSSGSMCSELPRM